MSNNTPAIISAGDLTAITTLADTFIKSGLFSDTKSQAQAVVKILAGRELGLGPFESMRDINIIQGKTAMAAAQIGARIKQTGVYDYEVVQFDDKAAILRFSKNGKALKPDVSFSFEDAKKLGLAGKDNYQKQARTMLFWRALTMGARMHCPHVFGGAIYTPDELSGQVVDAEPLPVAARVVESEPALPEPQAPQEVEVLPNPWAWKIQANITINRRELRGFLLKDLGAETIEKLLQKEQIREKLTESDVANMMAAVEEERAMKDDPANGWQFPEETPA